MNLAISLFAILILKVLFYELLITYVKAFDQVNSAVTLGIGETTTVVEKIVVVDKIKT